MGLRLRYVTLSPNKVGVLQARSVGIRCSFDASVPATFDALNFVGRDSPLGVALQATRRTCQAASAKKANHAKARGAWPHLVIQTIVVADKIEKLAVERDILSENIPVHLNLRELRLQIPQFLELLSEAVHFR